MSPKLKLILSITLKQAIGALLASTLISSQFHVLFNFDNRAGIFAFLRVAGSVVIAREVQVWGGRVYKWLFTNADPSELDKLDIAESKAKESESKAHEAVAAVQDAKASVKQP